MSASGTVRTVLPIKRNLVYQRRSHVDLFLHLYPSFFAFAAADTIYRPFQLVKLTFYRYFSLTLLIDLLAYVSLFRDYRSMWGLFCYIHIFCCPRGFVLVRSLIYLPARVANFIS